MQDKLNRDTVLDYIQSAKDMVAALNTPKGAKGSRDWIMSIPARADDPDMVIMQALTAAQLLIQEDGGND